jgi:hypothetical protein
MQASRENAKYYAERGIACDPSWDRFETFLADMGERPEGLTLDRIDNDLGYSKGNCRWATPLEQTHNRRAVIAYRRGQDNANSKLTATNVHEIRSLAGQMTQQAIADRSGVGRRAVGRILNGDRWGSLA